MMLTMFKSKVHRATVTQADLNYTGSLTLDPLLIEAAGMLVHEQVHVLNINTGARFTTYIIEGGRGSGVVCLNGAAARLGAPGDLIIALTYAEMTPEEARTHEPVVVHVDKNNHITEVVRGARAVVED
ncbi:MAG: aspartate 1-decarboxylase [Candidatus Hydrogenedens sp.]|nr:aspartate 1-decarboxylase [Candidatus Hydrogenedentota bacterium]NLF57351.1 aspartate 1-decarboxylase [Candidatus Hydrogenedens sp.]